MQIKEFGTFSTLFGWATTLLASQLWHLYLTDPIQPGLSLMITEGEFDALIVRQIANDLISVASSGSAANKWINSRWFPKLISAPRILICMDQDKAGEGAIARIRCLSQAVQCVQVPQGKDINDYYKIVGHTGTYFWIRENQSY